MNIFKILLPKQWSDFEATGTFRGAPIDLRDGYLHFSTGEQVDETANLHFSEHDEIVIARVDTTTIGDDLKWEESRGGAKFPHLYRELTLSEVTEHWAVKRENGVFKTGAQS